MSFTEPVRDKKKVAALMAFYRLRGQLRNHLLIVAAVHTALRISDLLRLTWDDVYDFKRRRFKSHIRLTEHKTGKSKAVAVHSAVKAALLMCRASAAPGKPLFMNKRTGRAISRIQAYRLIRSAAESLEFAEPVSCHSLRKTFGYHAWKDGVSPAVIMELYNHSSMAVTRRYLGVAQEDKDAVYLGLKFAG